jgi:sugar lactone lactonase YvrE
VYEIVAVDGRIPANPTIRQVGYGFLTPNGVAVDSFGNVYVSDNTSTSIEELLAVDGSVPSHPDFIKLGDNFAFPQGVAVDGNENVFVIDSSYGLSEFPAVDGSIPATQPLVPLVGGFTTSSEGLTLDSSGNVYVTDYNNGLAVELHVGPVNFGSANVCPAGQNTPAPCSNTLTLNFGIAANTTVGKIAILTGGAPNLDYTVQANDTSTTLCTAQTYASATNCTVDINFAPTAPGQRNGAMQILDGSGNLLATTRIYGTGTSPAISFQPGTQTTLGSGFSLPSGTAVDGNGNVYVTETGDTAVKEILAASGYTTVRTLSSVFVAPEGVAVDGSGNVYVADYGNGTVDELLAVNGSDQDFTTIRILSSGGSPVGVAVDSSGNVYVADRSGSVYDILAVAGAIPANPSSYFLGGGFSNPAGIAIDGSGNLYVTDSGNSAVYELLAAGGYSTVNTLGSGFRQPHGVSVDAAGDVFVGDTGNNAVKEMLAVNGSIPATNPTILTLGRGFNQPNGVAVDGKGNLYLGDQANNQIEKLDLSDPPSLDFISTPVHLVSADSPQSVQIQNIGNTTLAGSGSPLSDSTDFYLVPGSNIIPDCALSTISLPSGAECNLSFEFNPQSAGQLSSTLTLTDNALNANTAPQNTQTIALNGIGLPNAPPQVQISPAAVNFGPVPYPGGSTTQNVTITNIGGGTLAGITAASNGSSVTILNSTCAAGVTTGNSCALTLQFAPLYSAGTHTNTITVSTTNGGGGTVKTTGYAGAVVPSAMSLSFGSVSRGGTATLPLTFSNEGVPYPVTVSYITSSTSFKVISNGCTTGITTGSICMVEIEFAPVSKGSKAATIKFAPSSGPSYDITLTGTLDQ